MTYFSDLTVLLTWIASLRFRFSVQVFSFFWGEVLDDSLSCRQTTLSTVIMHHAKSNSNCMARAEENNRLVADLGEKSFRHSLT